MQKEGSDNDSQAGDDLKENEHPTGAKKMRTESDMWETSDINFLVETPVSEQCFWSINLGNYKS